MNKNITYNTIFEKELIDATNLYKKHTDVNKLEALEFYYQMTKNDYSDCSELALEKCIQQRLDFSSTSSTIDCILDKYIDIKCPECDMKMDYSNGKYECGYCKIVVSLDLNAIYFNFFQPYWDRIETSKAYLNSSKDLEIQIKGFRNNSNKGELLAKIIKMRKDNSIQVKVAYGWIIQNKLIKRTLEEAIEKIDTLEIEES